MNKTHLINKESLVSILSQHKVWLDSDNKRGVRAKFNDLNFYISSYHPHSDKSQVHNYFNQFDKNLIKSTNFKTTKTLMQGVLLKNAIFENCDFDGVLLQGANLENAEIRNTILNRSRLKGGHLKGAKIDGARFFHSYLRSASFDNARLINTTLSGSFCDRISFIQSNIENSNLSSTYLVKANFKESRITNTIFNKSNLRKSIFDHAHINNSELKYTKLKNTSFVKTHISNSSFTNSDLSYSDFSSTILQKINFENVIFDNSTFTNVNMQNASLMGSSFKNITIDEYTKDTLPIWIINQYGDTFEIKKTEENLNRIKKSIHFEPRHRQAGIGILSYFSKILDETYPNQDIRFRIEQNNNIVSLIIETPEGNLIERIEKTLMQYGEVITGLAPVNSITNNELLMLDIKNELRIAKLRVESQIELLAYKDKEITRLFDTITRSLDNTGVKLFLSQHVNNEHINMRDTYNAGQVAAQGPNSHAHDITFNQIWNQLQGKIDLPTLAKELSILRETMIKEAKSSQDYIDIGHISSAEEASKNNNGANALEYLKKGSKWTLETAEKIGIGVATAAIKTSLGI